METGIATHRVVTRSLEWKSRPARVTRMLFGWRKSCAGHRVATLATRAGGALKIVTSSPAKAGVHMPQWHAFAKWCAGALVLMMPGSFVVIAVLWIYRRRF